MITAGDEEIGLKTGAIISDGCQHPSSRRWPESIIDHDQRFSPPKESGEIGSLQCLMERFG
jgi:hypothetical protein